MNYRQLGRTGLQVSPLCLGTMNFGPETSELDSHRVMDQALELGINFFDTADVYGRKLGEGVTEQIIGRWLEVNPGNRDKVVLATKVYGKVGDGPNDQRLSAYHIRKACEANTLASQRHFMGLVAEQSLYNLNARMIELEVIPACGTFGLGLIPWSPLGGGLLGGALKKAEGGRRSSESMQEQITKHRPQLERYEALCSELGQDPADVALAWLLHNPVVTAPIIGPRTPEQLSGAMRALDLSLSKEVLNKLDEIWPGPGGQAPEAYAW